MRFSIPIVLAFISLAYSWEMTGYETADGCDETAEGDGRYRIWESTDTPSTECQRFGGTTDAATCAQYENGGFVGPIDCGSAVWNPRSVRIQAPTTVNGVEACYSCKFYSDDSCGTEWKDSSGESDVCYDLGYGPKSYICKADDWSC